MKVVLFLPLVLFSISAVLAEVWVEDEDVDEYNLEEEYQSHDPRERTRRDIVDEDEEEDEEDEEVYLRIKRECENHARIKRSSRPSRQLRQYEVHEFTDDAAPSSPPYEEMLAASAEHYHRTYQAPGAPAAARYLAPVSDAVPIALQLQPLHHNPQPVHQIINVAPNHKVQSLKEIPHQRRQPINIVPPPVFNPAFQAPRPNHNVKSVYSSSDNVPQPFVSYHHVPVANPPVPLPVPVASVPVSVPLLRLADDGDQSVAGAGHHQHHHHHHNGHGVAAGGGRHNHARHHKLHDAKKTKGSSSDHHVDKGGKGFKTDEHHRKEYEEALGKKKKHHDQAGHKGHHEEQAQGHKGSNFDEKKGHKKGHKTKGYHNKYHKDEFHKEHKFYDDFHKSGEHHRYGKFHAKHASNESGKKKAHRVNAGHDYVEKGKKGHSEKGHVDADHKAHRAKDGHEEHHQHHEDHGKKGGKEGGAHWGYQH